ncbi:MAG: hypothetical protein ACR2LN_01285 [Candidatus Levyibacteriota bacterium]
MNTFFGILSFILSFGATIPYVIDIIKGRARPARSTRILFLLLMLVTLIVQSHEFTSGVLLLTAGELATQIVLFVLSIKYGMGGLARLDIICYGAFIISLTTYLLTRDAALSLTLLVLTDLIAFLPTIVKIWRDPTSDTWVFYVVGGMAAATASLLARNSNSYTELVFPAYIFITNTLAALPILLYNKRNRKSDKKNH